MLIKSPELDGLWPVDVFKKAYQKESNIQACNLISYYDESDLSKAAIIITRVFIEKSLRVREGQKYIIGIRFYSFGDLATIDIISLDKDYHREICCEHLRKMNWPLWNDSMEQKIGDYNETFLAPFLFVGGHLKLDDNNLENFGSSGDYGDKIFFTDSNSVFNYLLSIAGLKSFSEKDDSGKNFIKKILEIMYKHKLKKSFYENLIKDIYFGTEKNSTLNSQQINSLVTMKVLDRYLLGGGDFLKIRIEELGGGIGQAVMLSSIAQKIK